MASFLKAATSGSAAASAEVRVGVSQAYVACLGRLGPGWLERHLGLVVGHLLELANSAAARSSSSATSHTELVYTRHECVGTAVSPGFRLRLRYPYQAILSECALVAIPV